MLAAAVFAERGEDRMAPTRQDPAERSSGTPDEKKAEAEAPMPPTENDPAAFRRPRGDLAAFSFHIAPPERELMILTRLGDPPGWRSPPTMLDILGPTVEAAAEKAREIAMGEDLPTPGAIDRGF